MKLFEKILKWGFSILGILLIVSFSGIPALIRVIWGAAYVITLWYNVKAFFAAKKGEKAARAKWLLLSAGILLGPAIPFWIFGGIFGLLAGIWNSISNMFITFIDDITFVNKTPYFIFALGEILVTVAAIGLCIYMVRNRWKHGDKITFSSIAVAVLIQRIYSWIYFSYTLSGIIAEVVIAALIVVAIFFGPKIVEKLDFDKFRHKKRKTKNIYYNDDDDE